MSGCAASGSSGSASGGPSTSTASGLSSPSARSTLRAEPGPWWRMPRMLTPTVLARSPHQLPAGAVQVIPAVPLPDHRLQVLLPDGPILDRILDHRAGEPGGHVGGGHVAAAEVSGERPAARHHRD